LSPQQRQLLGREVVVVDKRPSQSLPRSFGLCWLACLLAAPALAQPAKPTPPHGEELTAQGRSLIRAGRLKEAEDALRQAAQARGQSLDALYDLARVKFASGDYQKSRLACKALVDKDPQAALSNLCMARAFLVWRRATRADEFVA
jgi:tetratricopeptide (TPR) repeat protein